MSNVFGFVDKQAFWQNANTSNAGYVTLTTSQTISGYKTFDNDLTCNYNVNCLNLTTTNNVNASAVTATSFYPTAVYFPDGSIQTSAYSNAVSQITVSTDNSNQDCYLTFVKTPLTTTKSIYIDDQGTPNLRYNPSSGILSAGALTGSASIDAGSTLYMIPTAGPGQNNGIVQAGDAMILGIDATQTKNLTLTSWSNTKTGLRITPTSVLLGAGGSGGAYPTTSITCSSSGMALQSTACPTATGYSTVSTSDNSANLATTAWVQSVLAATPSTNILTTNNSWSGTNSFTAPTTMAAAEIRGGLTIKQGSGTNTSTLGQAGVAQSNTNNVFNGNTDFFLYDSGGSVGRPLSLLASQSVFQGDVTFANNPAFGASNVRNTNAMPATSDSSTIVPTTAWVQARINNAPSQAIVYPGSTLNTVTTYVVGVPTGARYVQFILIGGGGGGGVGGYDPNPIPDQNVWAGGNGGAGGYASTAVLTFPTSPTPTTTFTLNVGGGGSGGSGGSGTSGSPGINTTITYTNGVTVTLTAGGGGYGHNPSGNSGYDGGIGGTVSSSLSTVSNANFTNTSSGLAGHKNYPTYSSIPATNLNCFYYGQGGLGTYYPNNGVNGNPGAVILSYYS